MKKTGTIIILLITTNFCFSQQQQEYWYLNNQTVEVANGQASVNTFGNTTDAESVTNAIYDQNGDAVLYVSNYSVYSSSGFIGYITPQNTCVNKGTEIEIVPVPNSPCEYYIVFNAPISNPNSSCPCCFAQMNAFYATVDLSANNGQGTLTPVQNLTPNSLAERGNIAITKESNNKRNLYVTTHSNVSKFRISSNGIIFESIIYTEDLSSQGELDLSLQEDKLAINTISGLKILHLDSNGDLDVSSGNQGNGVSEYGIVHYFIAGTEFSVTGDYLYYSDDNDIYQLDLVSGNNNIINNTSDYSHSQLELGFDLNIYAVSNTNELGQISGIDTNTPLFNPNYLSVQAGNTDPNWSINIKTLPDQVDAADYSTFFQDCCINNEIVINLPSTISVCDGNFQEICGPIAPSGSTYSYEWYSTQNIPLPTSVLAGEDMCFMPSQTGIHTLVVTDENGCTANHTITITDSIPQPDLGTVDCEQAPFSNINILNQGFNNPDYTITWYHNGQVVQVGGETLIMSIEQGEITVTIAVDGCEPVSDTIEIYCCPDDLEIVMNCETGLLEVQNLPSNITINNIFWDYDSQTLPNSNSTTFQPTQDGFYSFGIIFTFPNGEKCHHFIHYDYKEKYCCEIIGSKANVSLLNPNNSFHYLPNTHYGPMEIPAMCERVVLDGSLSSCEDGYFISIAAFDPISWMDDPTVTPNPIYQGWTQGQAPNFIDLTQPPFNITFVNQTYYMIQFAVGPNWDAEYILFWYDCDTKREMVVSPNPTQSEFTVSMPNNEEEGSLEVLDFYGNSVFRGSVSGDKPSQVNISRAVPGVYLVRIIVEGEVYLKKIIKK